MCRVGRRGATVFERENEIAVKARGKYMYTSRTLQVPDSRVVDSCGRSFAQIKITRIK